MKKVVVLLASGFEEIEAVTVIDVLRRADLPVEVLALGTQREVAGSHGIRLVADGLLAGADLSRAGAVVLPGGMPGSVHLAEDAGVRRLLQEVAAGGGVVAAVCAAPLALGAAGLLAGRKYTCFPGVEKKIGVPGHTGSRVETDGQVVTGQSAGAAMEFALAVVARLQGPAAAATLRQAMLI